MSNLMVSDPQLQQLAKQVGQQCLDTKNILATAESCTGGWIAKIVTDIAGSSAWFDSGVVSYSNQAKKDFLNVPENVLNTHGAVSEETAIAMVSGLLGYAIPQATVGVAVTGIAGPDGGSAEKPVGLVWIAWLAKGNQVITQKCLFDGDREQVRRQVVQTALQGVLKLI